MSYRLFKLIVLVFLTLAVTACNNKASKDTKYGSKLLFKQTISKLDLERIKEFDRNPLIAETKKAKVSTGFFPDVEKWQANKSIPVESQKGPYKIVLIAKGKASSSGESLIHWIAMWDFDGVSKGAPGTPASKKGVSPSEDLTLVFKSPPLRFEKSGEALPVAEFVRTQNFDIAEIEMQIWYGMESNSWIDYLFSFQALLVGVIFLFLVWRFRN